MFAIRARRKTVSEKDFLDAVQKVRCMASGRPCPGVVTASVAEAAPGHAEGCQLSRLPGCRSSRATRSSVLRPSTWSTTELGEALLCALWPCWQSSSSLYQSLAS